MFFFFINQYYGIYVSHTRKRVLLQVTDFMCMNMRALSILCDVPMTALLPVAADFPIRKNGRLLVQHLCLFLLLFP